MSISNQPSDTTRSFPPITIWPPARRGVADSLDEDVDQLLAELERGRVRLPLVVLAEHEVGALVAHPLPGCPGGAQLQQTDSPGKLPKLHYS